MNINTIVLTGILVVLLITALFLQGTTGVCEGVKSSGRTFEHVWPLLLLAFLIAGMLQVLIPQELISSYIGPESGFKGFVIAWGCGALLPGAPYTVLPVAATLMKGGAAIGPIMTLVLSSSIGVALTRIPYEVAFIGPRFVLLRVLSCLIIPFIGGGIALGLNRLLRIFP